VTALRCVLAGSLLAALLTNGATGSAAPVPADRARAEKELQALKAKLCGSWRGGPCEGCLTLRADGTYSWTEIGPGGDQHFGAWGLKGDPAQPTLVLKCAEADDKELEGKVIELKLLRVADAGIEFKEPGAEKPKNFSRVKTDDNP